MENTRLFVGNLPADTKEDYLKTKFSPYGQVLKVELKERKFLQPPSCFSFVTIGASRHSLQKCIYDLSDGYAWNGHPVTVDFAKESFLSRLEKERLDPKNKNIIIEEKPTYFVSNIKSTESKNSQDRKIAINSKKFSKDESEDSDSDDSSDSDSDDSVSSNDKIVNKSSDRVSLDNPIKKSQDIKRTITHNSKKISREESDSSESDSDGEETNLNKIVNKSSDGTVSLGNPVKKSQDVNSTITHNSKKNSREESDSSKSDSDNKETNLNKIVNQTNDVMKQFEQFSSVWQSSEEDENDTDSSEEIFEAFKTKPNADTGIKDATSSSASQSRSSFPENNRSGDFVKFVKSRQPQVQSKTEINIFSEVKVSSFPKVGNKNKVASVFTEVKESNFLLKNKHQETNGFPKFESKNKKIMFDDIEAKSEIKTNVMNEGSKFPRSTQFQRNDTIVQSTTHTNVKPVKTQARNHVDAENKRRNAMEERIKEISDKKKAIKLALANVDGQQKNVNKKIIFSQDSDYEEDLSQRNPLQQPDLNAEQQLNLLQEINGGGKWNAKMNDNETRGGKKDVKSLFDEDGSEEDDDDSEGEFKIKKQFEGDKGLKLLELQASYNNDTRFNLDDRFVEDEEEEEEDRAMEPVEEQSEKEKQMQILENVLGYKVKQHQTKNGLLSVPRFDPLNPDCKSLLQVKVKSDANTSKRKRKQRDQPVEVSGEKFYQLDEAYFTSSKEKKEKLDEPFSLLKMLNRDNNSDDENNAHSENFPNSIKTKSSSTAEDYRTEPLGKSSNPFASVGARFEYDSSDTEDEEEEIKGRGTEKRVEKQKENGQFGTSKDRVGQFGTGLAPPPSLSEKMFFLSKDDDRLKEAQEFWKQKPTLPLSGDSFKLKRRELALKLKTKIRRNLKNSKLSKHMKKRKQTTKMMKTQRRR